MAMWMFAFTPKAKSLHHLRRYRGPSNFSANFQIFDIASHVPVLRTMKVEKPGLSRIAMPRSMACYQPWEGKLKAENGSTPGIIT